MRLLIPYPVDDRGSVQVTSSPASPEDKNHQHCSSDNKKDSTIKNSRYGIVSKEYVVNNEVENILDDEFKDKPKQKSQVGAVNSKERTLQHGDLPSGATTGMFSYLLMLSTNHFSTLFV